MSGAIAEYTKYFEFEVPQFDFPSWHTYYSRNIKTIDSILYLMTGTDSLRGTWKNSTLYKIGDRVIDVDNSLAFECFVEHTSMAVPTLFSQDRTAHPTYWQEVTFISSSMAGTSSSTVTIAEATNRTFITQTGRLFTVGAKIIANYTGSPNTDYMWGYVVSYVGNTLVMYSEFAAGHNNVWSAWNLSIVVRGELGVREVVIRVRKVCRD